MSENSETSDAGGLTHFDEAGRARMVDVGAKPDTAREAVARGTVHMRPETLARIREGRVAKGDVLAVAQVAGIMAAKNTPQLIPMCHTLLLTGVDLAFHLSDPGDAAASVAIEATVRTVGKTGAEMEALTAVSAAALTIYDMCKAVDREMTIERVRLARKSGGKSGTFERAEDAAPR
jgi:cyclic pyranopterin monophosphate synthase